MLELLVVLLIFSFLSALVVPQLTTLYHSLQLAYTRDEIINQIGSLGYQAFQQRQNFKLISYPPLTNLEDTEATKQPILPLKLPAGWRIETKNPILFQANGVCHGGTVFLHYQTQTFRLILEPPFCQPQR